MLTYLSYVSYYTLWAGLVKLQLLNIFTRLFLIAAWLFAIHCNPRESITISVFAADIGLFYAHIIAFEFLARRFCLEMEFANCYVWAFTIWLNLKLGLLPPDLIILLKQASHEDETSRNLQFRVLSRDRDFWPGQ